MDPTPSLARSTLHCAAALQADPIVITGMGIVSAAGPDITSLWDRALDAAPLATWQTLTTPQGPATITGCAPPTLPWLHHPWAAHARRMDLAGRMALHAGWQAITQAGLPLPTDHLLGVITGSSRGPLEAWHEMHSNATAGRRTRPSLAATTTLAAANGALSGALHAHGPSWLTSAACASSAYSLAHAAEQLLLGNATHMLAGGTDHSLQPLVLSGLAAARVLAPSLSGALATCRPFCRTRTGLVPGSGAAMLLLERLTTARARGAEPLAALSGWSLRSDPEGLAGIHPEGRGLQSTMQSALRMAQLAPRDIGHLSAHGTGTIANDAAETIAISAVFGPDSVPCASTKPITGHCLGATTAMEAILAIQSLRHTRLIPAHPTSTPLPGLYLSPGGHAPALRHILCNAAAFWGSHASLIFSRIAPPMTKAPCDKEAPCDCAQPAARLSAQATAQATAHVAPS